MRRYRDRGGGSNALLVLRMNELEPMFRMREIFFRFPSQQCLDLRTHIEKAWRRPHVQNVGDGWDRFDERLKATLDFSKGRPRTRLLRSRDHDASRRMSR